MLGQAETLPTIADDFGGLCVYRERSLSRVLGLHDKPRRRTVNNLWRSPAPCSDPARRQALTLRHLFCARSWRNLSRDAKQADAPCRAVALQVMVEMKSDTLDVKVDALFDDDEATKHEGLDDALLVGAAARWDAVDYDDVSNPSVMKLFYARLFPFRQLFRWLNGSEKPNSNWTHRELAFTLANDVYLRYQSFTNDADLRKEILRLNPSRFEIGPIYTSRPRDRRTVNKAAFKPVRRELVMDIDMDEYDAIRTCCTGKKICKRCWGFIAMAAKVLDTALREDFGFEHLLWVYSGRRGIHCWISDPAACSLNDDQRRAIVNYLEVIKGGGGQDKKVNLHRPLHPSLKRAYEQLKPYFNDVILKDQDAFDTDERWEALLRIVPDDVANRCRAEWTGKNISSSLKWRDLLSSVGKYKTKGKESAKDIVEDVILQYTYPRLDAEVSKHLNHLLKSPFVVHPGTGRVCVPILPKDIDDFDPEAVPTVGQLLRELEQADARGNAGSNDWESTSLAPYVRLYKAHIDSFPGFQPSSKSVKAESTEF
ncbi:uncharacterized protein L969DRAFT_96678 [Mixia osmundae IAM 14324]|uniref:DNA primase n=1 Tax=Mixia osmundae (strain CBS 9802 / IAM 14324 / JCM 22182 / KY 12970) TaxID=764103 RepID=G7DSU2_MIXOS|nr:uncharacterized protein L969DRAFT_96678 [Mixia osmundae IAM 14324]KEI37108.1 hypothetical protein L969DRAFT_96678 [Mixia osmundae IAM 14324]GAA93652.1 hypothetical protein E5Q_00297 [Mixia osmundae IAM 14324]